MIKALIFDCFGLLYPDTSIDFYRKHKDLFGGDSKVFDEINFQVDFGKISKAESYAAFQKITGLPIDEIKNEWEQKMIVDQNLVEFIKKLKGKYKIGLLSNAGEEEIEIIYRDKIDNLFDAITISYEAGCVKPDREIFLTCVKRLDLEASECIFIDDRMSNLEAAERLGMKGILYKDFATFAQNFESYL